MPTPPETISAPVAVELLAVVLAIVTTPAPSIRMRSVSFVPNTMGFATEHPMSRPLFDAPKAFSPT